MSRTMFWHVPSHGQASAASTACRGRERLPADQPKPSHSALVRCAEYLLRVLSREGPQARIRRTALTLTQQARPSRVASRSSASRSAHTYLPAKQSV